VNTTVTLSNYRVNPPVRAVTSPAKNAGSAPARPAGYAERYAHRRGTERRMHRLILVAVILASALQAYALDEKITDCCGPIACSLCPPPRLDAVEDMPRLAEKAPLLFVGIVVKAETSPCCDSRADVTLRVLKAWKGVGLTTLTIRIDGHNSSWYWFAIGQQYLIASTGSAVLCQFNPLEVSHARQHIQALDDWRRVKYDSESR